jgi:adenylate cyclase
MKTTRKIKIPLLFKLALLTVLLTSAAVVINTIYTSRLFEEISLDREQSNQQSLVNALASQVELILQGVLDRLTRHAGEAVKFKKEGNFYTDRDFIYIEVLDLERDQQWSKTNISLIKDDKELPQEKEQVEKIFKTLISEYHVELAAVKAGKTLIFSSEKKLHLPYLIIGAPVAKENAEVKAIAWAVLRPGIFQPSLGDIDQAYLVDYRGHLVGASDESIFLGSQSWRQLDKAKDAFTENQNRFTQRFIEKSLISTAKLDFGLSIIKEVSQDYLKAPSTHAKQVSLFIMGLIVSVAFFMGVVFSHSLSSNIEKMVILTRKVAKGSFDIKATSVVKSHDEVGILAEALDEMALGLKEREKIKDMFSKFHGDTVTETLMNQDDLRKSQRKDVVVFFSDIRGFTSFSEGKSPEEVVEMLNEYFQVMVSIIQKHGGVVDKFVGDAIMAVWGAPVAHDDDAQRAMKACLEMRQELDILNQSRISRSLVPIKMGMGLHAGPALSGSIGSDSRMEFTVIGDTVNTASRIEAATKAHGTDFLISDAVLALVGADFIAQPSGETYAKGKTRPLKLFKVLGYFNEHGLPVEIQTPWSESKAEVEEEKIKIAS